jgi:hypothetical protein
MIERVILRTIWLLLLWAISVLAGDVTGLQQQSEIKITAQMVSAPVERESLPFFWAISFSPDGKNLALGLQFARKTDHSLHSYLLMVSTERPGVVLKKFETPPQTQVRNLSTIVWSRDGRFLVVTPYGEWEHAAVLDVGAGQLHVVPDRIGVLWCGSAVGLLPEPRVVQQCSLESRDTAVRFLPIDGTTTAKWTFPGVVSLLGISPDGKMLALDIPGSSDKIPPRPQHDIVIFNVSDRTEARRWHLPEAFAYRGTFAKSGTAFCMVPDANSVNLKHEVVCRNITTGEVISRIGLPQGPVYEIASGGNRLVLRHSAVVILPFRLFGTNYFLTHEDWYISDLQTGQAIAQWRIDPKPETSSEFSVSSDGECVAAGESGRLRVYHVSP